MKFNKFTAIILSIMFLVSNTGLAFSVHYCGGKVASVRLKTVFSSNKIDDCCGEIEMDSNCCKDKIFHFQKKSDDSVLKSFIFNFEYNIQNQDWKPIVFNPIIGYKNNPNTSFYCNTHAPPLYKLHHQFIFYG